MIKPILLAILIIFLSLVFSPIANATGEVTLGGKIDDGDLSIVTSVDHSWQGKRFINDVEFDYRYKDSNNVKKTNRGLIAFKQRYELQSRHYLFSLLRFDYNEFRSINSRIQSTYGWGYKIFKTEKLKMSNEIATGLLYTNNGNELIFRNSLWISYDVAPKIKFTNNKEVSLLIQLLKKHFIVRSLTFPNDPKIWKLGKYRILKVYTKKSSFKRGPISNSL